MIFRLFFKGDFLPFEGNFDPRNRVALKVRLIYAIRIMKGSRKMTRQFKKNQLKQIQNQSQSGRSMIEMLGVLAIIAILSIGGIVGFRLAMNYYQANQIAHEMNIMRTDAQIKIAQGAEELTLGDPYDSGNIQFNGYKTDFDCLYMETETSTPDDVASCAVANAYYIEMQKIPEGICKPLANLIDKMDNEIAFYINGKSVDAAEGEKGICLGEENILTVIFGADSDSAAIKCNDDPDCPDNLPICHEHLCVECETEEDCPYNTQYCEGNACQTCPDNQIWGGAGKGCVECLTYEDCTDPEKPKCEQTTNKCKSCYEIDPEKPLWNGTNCEACPENKPWNGELCGCEDNDDCAEDEYCNTTGTSYCVNGENINANQGTCTTILYEEKTIEGKGTYYKLETSVPLIDWWSAVRFCQALRDKKHVSSGTLLNLNELVCTSENGDCPDPQLWQLLHTFGKWGRDMWTLTGVNDNLCDMCSVYLYDGSILCDNRRYGSVALCK